MIFFDGRSGITQDNKVVEGHTSLDIKVTRDRIKNGMHLIWVPLFVSSYVYGFYHVPLFL